MLQPPQPAPAPSEPPKAVIGGSNNPHPEPGLSSVAPAASQTSSSEGVNQSQSHQVNQVNESASANSHGAKGSEAGLHLGEILQSLIDQGPANSSPKATAATTGNTTTGNTTTGLNQQGTTAVAASPSTTEPGAQAKSATGKASLLSALEELNATPAQSASTSQNAPESGSSNSTAGDTKASMQNAPATSGTTQVQASQLASSQILDPTIKASSPTGNLVGKAPLNTSAKGTEPKWLSFSERSCPAAKIACTGSAGFIPGGPRRPNLLRVSSRPRRDLLGKWTNGQRPGNWPDGKCHPGRHADEHSTHHPTKPNSDHYCVVAEFNFCGSVELLQLAAGVAFSGCQG